MTQTHHERVLEQSNEAIARQDERVARERINSPVDSAAAAAEAEAECAPTPSDWTEEEWEDMRYAAAARRKGIDVTLNSVYRRASPVVFFRHDRHPPKGAKGYWMAETAREAYEDARADNFGRDWPTEEPVCPECGEPV